MTATAAPKLVGRHLRVAFMNTDATGSSPKFERMTNFTTMTNGKNPKEYSRQYVDEIAERADVVGYAPAIEYSFDRYTNNPVHEKIATIHDGEKLGDDAHVEVVVVDFFKKSDNGDKCYATKRTYAVIPDSDGDGTDALVYSGSLKSVSDIEDGYVAETDFTSKTVTYTKGDYAAVE